MSRRLYHRRCLGCKRLVVKTAGDSGYCKQCINAARTGARKPPPAWAGQRKPS